MIIKIGKMIYDTRVDSEPVMLVFTKKEKEQIAAMSPTDTKYAITPAGWLPDKVKQWMGVI